MTDEIELTSLAEVDDQQRADFYAAVFGVRAAWLAKHWRWWYRIGAFPGTESLAAVAGDRMIGQAGAIPVELEINGARERATWFIDFAIRPELQRHGLGKKLTEAWMRLAPVQVTFCNDRSMGIFRKYGWSERFDNVRCGLPLRPERLVGRRLPAAAVAGGAWRLAVRSFVAGAPEVWPGPLGNLASSDEDGDVKVVRDASWTTWRLHSGPFAEDHRAFRLENAVAVVRGLVWNGRRRVHLLLLTGGSARERMQLARGLVRWALSAEIDLVWAAPVDERMKKTMRAVLPLQRKLRFAAFAGESALMQKLTGGALALQPCDSDADLFYTPDSDVRFAWT